VGKAEGTTKEDAPGNRAWAGADAALQETNASKAVKKNNTLVIVGNEKTKAKTKAM
jgi:hypothetical protein